jgi:uncharacterized membrane protein
MLMTRTSSTAVLAAAVAMALATQGKPVNAASPEMEKMMAEAAEAIKAGKIEKCYGVAKAGGNDCQTATASCAGSSTKDADKAAFIAVPKGTCERIAGGSLNPS